MEKADKLRYPDHTREEIVAAYQNAMEIIPYPDLRIKAEMDLALRYPEWDDWYGALAIYERLLPGMAGRQDISSMNYWIIRRYAETCRHLGRHHDALRLLHEVYADDSPMCPVYNRAAIAKLIIEHAEYSDNVDVRYQQLVDLRGFYPGDTEFHKELEVRISEVAITVGYQRLKAEGKTGN